MFIRLLACNFLLLRRPYPVSYQGNAGLIKWVWNCPLLFYFLEEFEKNWYELLCVCLVDFACETTRSWAFLCWEVFSYWFSLLFHSSSFVEIFLFLPDLTLVGCMFLRIDPFLLGCSACWCVRDFPSYSLVCSFTRTCASVWDAGFNTLIKRSARLQRTGASRVGASWWLSGVDVLGVCACTWVWVCLCVCVHVSVYYVC